MRLWTVHPRYLDRKGLVAVWREALLAQSVLQNKTRGYRNHPQLRRFQASPDAPGAIGAFLQAIYEEATARVYHFDRAKIHRAVFDGQIPCTRGQLQYECQHLREKLRQRDPSRFQELENIKEPQPHPLFHIIEGDIEAWEVRKSRRQPFNISS